jgi:hypothetical protein
MRAPVGTDEVLFRRVTETVGDQLCYRKEGGRVVFLHAAFNDAYKKPSVDRARLKWRSDPHQTRLVPAEGIVALGADAVRRLGPIARLDQKGREMADAYAVDVLPDPVRANCAHAVIALSPATAGAGAFRRLKEGLVRLATESGWAVEPNAVIPKRLCRKCGDLLLCVMNRIKGTL